MNDTTTGQVDAPGAEPIEAETAPEIPEPKPSGMKTRPVPRVQVGATMLPQNGDVDTWTPQQRAIVTAAGLVTHYPDWYGGEDENGNALAGRAVPAPPAVVEQFLSLCRQTGLNPLARQIYCIGRFSPKNGFEWSIQTGIDGFRTAAERTGKYAGQDPVQWLTSDQKWVDVFLPGIHGDHPLAARATVWRDGWTRPSIAVAEWTAYVQTTSKGEVVAMWKKQGAGQLAKCAEALAFRRAFPQDLSGVYTDDEMSGPAAAIEASREDAQTADQGWSEWEQKIAASEDLGVLAAVRAHLDQIPNVPREVYAALLARMAALSIPEDDEHEPTTAEAETGVSGPEDPEPAPAPTENVPTPENGAQGDDPEWTGDPCPACGGNHDPSVHDVEPEPEPVVGEQPAPPAARRGFDSSAMRRTK